MIKLFKKIYFTERNRKVGGGARSVFWWVRLVWFSWQQTTTYNGLKLILIIAMRNILILLTFRFCEIFLRFCYKHTTIYEFTIDLKVLCLLKSVQDMVCLHIFPIFLFLAKMLSLLSRNDNIFARNENI